MNEGRRFNRAWLVLFALIGSLVAMEITLQLGAFVVGRVAGQRAIAPGQGAVILCVGDSHTFGLPLPVEESYPSQLQAALDARHGEGTFRVANLGIPSVNSDFVLNRLDRQIVQLDPVVVIVWVGINNLWNAVELDARDEGVGAQLWRLARRSRLVRLASIAFYEGSGHQYDPDVRGGWYEGEAAPSG
ncbi:MAG: GDSL-type esterase/lipase family protein, partial [Actinomycetota bacterium]|nr:GDSL-type esterase/lipase family protein [Actinomycetota bacterium]